MPALLFAALALAAAQTSFGSSLYFQGFETDTSGWTPDTGGSPVGTITRVASGGGSLGLTAADGSYYAEVTNSPNSYLPGYGTGGLSFFGNSSAPPYPGSPFTQSIDVYVNTLLTMGAGVQDGFWIDDAPSSTSPTDVTFNGGIGYGAEHNFQLAYNGGSVGISLDGGTSPLYTVTTSGWYDFQFTYSQSDANPTDISNTTLTIATVGGTALASQTLENDSHGGTPLENQYLAGPGYTRLPVWANGFSNDVLGIDDVQAFTNATATPEPSGFAFCGIGLAALVFAASRRRRSSRSVIDALTARYIGYSSEPAEPA
jgi:hypothetical protein